MTAFTPCKGLAACRDDGRRCLTCGRDLGEIARLRDLIDGLAIQHGYENVESYTSYVAEKVAKKVRHRRQQAEG